MSNEPEPIEATTWEAQFTLVPENSVEILDLRALVGPGHPPVIALKYGMDPETQNVVVNGTAGGFPGEDPGSVMTYVIEFLRETLAVLEADHE